MMNRSGPRGQLGDLDMHLGHQRQVASKMLKPRARGLVLHGAAHAVGAEDQRGAGRHLGQILDEDRALGLGGRSPRRCVHDPWRT